MENDDQQYDAAEREMDLCRAEITRVTAERDDYAARLKATDQSWTRLAAERDKLRGGMAALATEMHAEAQAVTGSEPDGMPDITDRVRAQVLHEAASRIRQALSHAGLPS